MQIYTPATALASLLAATVSSGALAQQARAAAQAAQQPPTRSAGGATAPSGTYSESEVQRFARLAIALQNLQKDTAMPAADKQAKMAAAVEQSGLQPQRFNEIAAASQSDAVLMKRIQMAAAKSQAAKPSQ